EAARLPASSAVHWPPVVGQVTVPPFGLTTWPVVQVFAGEARNQITSAISSGAAIRPSGIWAISSGVRSVAGSRSVSVGPGATQLTRIPWGASSRASDFVRPITPAFDAQY